LKPNKKWIKDWQINENPLRERNLSHDLLRLFTDFWDAQGLDEKSKTTRNRYAGSLHALGGYLVERGISKDEADMNADELFYEYISPYEGPLIHQDNETWQEEIDMVSRKLYKYMESKTTDTHKT
jgi:hypothetical protein